MKNLCQTTMLHIRVTKEEKEKIEKITKKYNFRSISDFIRFISLNDWDIEIKSE